MADQTAENLSATRDVRFTAGGLMSLAWKLARQGDVAEEPDAKDYEFMRKWLNVKLHSVAARARIARSVVRHSITITATKTASYALDDDIFDVFGRATFSTDGTYERLVMPMGRDEFTNISYKATPGEPSRYYPEKTSVVTIYPWPLSETAGTLIVQAAKWLQDVSTTAQTVDLERYFEEYLITGLARKVAMTKSIDMDYVAYLGNEEEKLFQLALGSSKQRGGAQFFMTHRTGWTK